MTKFQSNLAIGLLLVILAQQLGEGWYAFFLMVFACVWLSLALWYAITE